MVWYFVKAVYVFNICEVIKANTALFRIHKNYKEIPTLCAIKIFEHLISNIRAIIKQVVQPQS